MLNCPEISLNLFHSFAESIHLSSFCWYSSINIVKQKFHSYLRKYLYNEPIFFCSVLFNYIFQQQLRIPIIKAKIITGKKFHNLLECIIFSYKVKFIVKSNILRINKIRRFFPYQVQSSRFIGCFFINFFIF